MKKEYKKEHNIRGVRYAIALTKENIKGMPGFAPDYFDKEVGDVVIRYLDFAPYFAPSDNPPNLEIEDVEEILRLLKSEFKEEDFRKELPKL